MPLHWHLLTLFLCHFWVLLIYLCSLYVWEDLQTKLEKPCFHMFLQSLFQRLLSKDTLYYKLFLKNSIYQNVLPDLLCTAFNTPTGMPYGTVNLRYGIPPSETPVTCTAGCGTFIVEFGTISALTGMLIYTDRLENHNNNKIIIKLLI